MAKNTLKKILIVEDDFICRKVLNINLSKFGACEIAVDGQEAVEAFSLALSEKKPYDLVCLDIMMPRKNGQETLKEIRELEHNAGVVEGHGAKVIMVTALSDHKNIMEAFREQCDSYIVKPIKKENLIDKLKELEFID